MFETILTRDVLVKDYLELGLSRNEIARKYDTTAQTVNKYAKLHKIPKRPTWAWKSGDLTGRRFNRLVALERSALDKHHKSRWICQCDCGNKRVINASSLLRGLTNSCGCLRHELAHKGYKDISVQWWRRLANSARQRGYLFLITPQEVWEFYERQNYRCALTDYPIFFCPDGNKTIKCTASIDRIDSLGDYTPDNIQLVHKVVNMMKNFYSQEDFITICNLVAKKNPREYENCINRTLARVAFKI